MHLNYSFLTQIGLKVTQDHIILIKTNNLALFFSIFVLSSLHQAILSINQLVVAVKCPPSQYQRCRLLNRYHTHRLVRGMARIFFF